MNTKNVIFGLLALIFSACAEKGTREIKGEFLYSADAAVIKGDSFIYGVEIDDKTMQLADSVKRYKKDEFDMVPVEIEGVLSEKEKGAEGWDTIVQIKKILSVSPPLTKPE